MLRSDADDVIDPLALAMRRRANVFAAHVISEVIVPTSRTVSRAAS